MASLLEIVIFMSTFALVGLFVQRFMNKSGKRRRLPPCLPSLPLVGSIPFFRDFDNVPDYFRKQAKTLGPVFGLYIGSQFCIVLNDLETIQNAFLKHATSFADRVQIFCEQEYTNKNDKGIAQKHYDAKFKHFHRLTLSILKDFGFGFKSQMEERILVEVEMLMKRLVETKGQSFNPKEMLYWRISNLISGFVFGRSFDDTEERRQTLKRLISGLDMFSGGLESPVAVFPILRFFPLFRKHLQNTVDGMSEILNILEKEIEEIVNDSDSPDCFCKQYIRKEEPDYDREQLMYTVRDLYIAGTETSSLSLIWMAILLANNPQVQERIHQEMDEVVPRDRFPTTSDKSKLPYLEAVILEAMRITAPLPIGVARATLTDTETNGYFVPAGTMVIANLYSVHMDPKTWQDPTVFRPERFLDDDGKVTDRNKIIPFSLGKRSCLGEVLAVQEIFLFLSAIVQRFDILPPLGMDKVEDTLKAVGFMSRPSPSVELRFVLRKDNWA